MRGGVEIARLFQQLFVSADVPENQSCSDTRETRKLDWAGGHPALFPPGPLPLFIIGGPI